MQDLPELIPTPIEFEIAGRKLTFAPLTIGDLAALGSHVKQKRLKEYREATTGMDQVIIAAGIESIIKAEVNADVRSPDAIQFLIHRSLKAAQPDMTLDQVGEMLSIANIAEVMTIVESIGGATKN